MAFTFDLDNKGYIKKRESYNLEYKQNFQLGDNLIKYCKTLVGMANNKGGEIVFGIKNSPHEPIGMTNNHFQEVDPKKIDSTIREYFSQELKWTMNAVRFNDKDFGIITVEESEEKPIICKKNCKDILREGTIYYRYRGESKEIEFAELKKLLDKEREKERILWIKHIERISIIGPKNVHLLDSYKGELSVGDNKILIDKNLIEKLHFIKEGNFTEKEGEGLPTLKLIGNVEGIEAENIVAKPDVLYPLTTSDVQTRLSLNSHEVQAIFHKLKIKSNSKFHAGISMGRKKEQIFHKYTESLIPVLQRMLQRPSFLQECVDEYKEYRKNLPKKSKRRR